MAALVEETIEKATQSVIERDVKLAEIVRNGDSVIDELEIEIEEGCLKALALHQPVAIDLRYIVSVMKINSDLERMGDLSCNIARNTVVLANSEPVTPGYDFRALSGIVLDMVKKCLNALLNRDSKLAREVIAEDDKVDEVKRNGNTWVLKAITDNPAKAELFLRHLSGVRNLERIGDLATNIAEDVIYLVEGNIVRHQMGGD